MLKSKGQFCSKKCQRPTDKTKHKMSDSHKGENNHFYGKHHTDETRQKISDLQTGRIHTEETKNKKRGNNNPNWKGGITELNIPLYETYVSQLEPYEQCRNNDGYLEVMCTNCGIWFVPKATDVRNRIQCINGNPNFYGESRFYCSDKCKQNCPIFGMRPEYLIARDEIRAGHRNIPDHTREVKSQLRDLVLARDNYTCQICGSKENLICHHMKV